MGWVSDRFAEKQAEIDGVPKLWDAFRDAVGRAVSEYENWVGENAVAVNDCMAHGNSLCIRLNRSSDHASIEIFLEPESRVLKLAPQQRGNSRQVCSYRISQGVVEFFVSHDGDIQAISPDEASRLSMDEFLFKPFPHVKGRA